MQVAPTDAVPSRMVSQTDLMFVETLLVHLVIALVRDNKLQSISPSLRPVDLGQTNL
jgi:hypothetical protein